MENDSTTNTKAKQISWWNRLWQFDTYTSHQWFRFLVIFLLLSGALYLLLHIMVPTRAGYEYAKLDDKQIQQVNRIYFDTTLNRLCDSLKGEKEECQHCKRAIQYINNEFSSKVEPKQMASVEKYICSATSLEATSFLANTRFKVQSYFWLIGPEVYFEIAFWSIFGVISSLLFKMGDLMRESTSDPKNQKTIFDSSEIPFQVSKILYAPLCTLVIVLGYNFFNDQNIADISSSKGVIVFAFLGGFYSSRLIAFLDRLKEVILPNSGSADLPPVQKQIQTTLKNQVIDLELDDSLEAELKSEIAEIGLRDAKVSLQPEEGGDEIEAVPFGENQTSTFEVPQLRLGKYTITASWSREVKVNGEDVPVNLVGEKSEQITNKDAPVKILLKKAKEEG